MDVDAAVRAVLDDWGVAPTEGRGINNGECEPFAYDVVAKADADLRVMTTRDLPSQYVLDAEREGGAPEPWHVWVTDGNRHYDAEVPDGVERWEDLPIFQRTLGL